jgi:hypothetical protein
MQAATFSADGYARDLVRRRALSVATTYLYFPLRDRLFDALAAGRLTVGDLGTLEDRELLERAGVALAAERDVWP